MSAKPIPAGFHTVTPFLLVRDATRLLAFLEQAFGTETAECLKTPDGKVMHAQLRIGDSMIMMGEAGDRCEPKPCMLYVYVPDADAVYNQALRAGATEVMPMTDQFYGDRSGGVKDPEGNEWWIATHIEDVSEAELLRRAAEARKPGK